MDELVRAGPGSERRPDCPHRVYPHPMAAREEDPGDAGGADERKPVRGDGPQVDPLFMLPVEGHASEQASGLIQDRADPAGLHGLVRSAELHSPCDAQPPLVRRACDPRHRKVDRVARLLIGVDEERVTAPCLDPDL